MKKCPNCGYEIETPVRAAMTEKDWAYTKTNNSNKNDALKKAEIRQRLELGYGISESETDLGSCITGIWKDNNKNMEK